MDLTNPAANALSGETFSFIHIYKTAGTTFLRMLDNFFHHKVVCPVFNNLALSKLPGDELPGYRLFRGHLNYFILCQMLDKKPKTLTFLRNPYDHPVSFYFHLKRLTDEEYIAMQANLDLTRLIFRVKQTLNPGAIDPANSDDRILGVALTKIEFTPPELKTPRIHQAPGV